MNSKNDPSIMNGVLLAIPIWFPLFYSVAFWIELKFTKHGLFNELGAFALFAAPLVGGLPILTSTTNPVWVKLLLFPIYYLIGVFVAGVIGWGLCMEMHTCH